MEADKEVVPVSLAPETSISEEERKRISGRSEGSWKNGRNSVRSSVASQASKSRASRVQRYSQFEAIPGVKVRDFAFPTTDPRHYGLPLPKNSASSSRSNSSDWFNSSSDEDETTSYGSAERLFESDDDDHRGRGQYRMQPRAHPNDVEAHDMNNLVLPEFAKQLREHLGGVELGFYRARAMFDFQKVTEWEMTIAEGDEIFIAFIGWLDGDDVGSDTKPMEMDEEAENKTGDPEKEEKAGEKEVGGEIEREDTSGDPQSMESEEVDDSATPTASRDSGLNERWASIDYVADDLLTIVHGGSKTTGDLNDRPAITVHSNPAPSDLAAQLNQLLDYAGVYGAGWATALRLKCRGKLEEMVSQAKSKGKDAETDTETRPKKGKVKIKLVEMGLVPGNYIEKINQ
ncbi:uncharacterized protein SPPG_03245 [Spizellomyces punctatus DAOM BR117]|uniref:Uncharacterized protein n=1 Tax=Spizellomyces punctatus (strain DAOM BR117) TaxID=645134 RepID=A0A0L0HIZ8_SPIPD|nr:uncharacterized protein SPPG_03245 [Spizellomyces punctatus DAOM BR117]KND01441.1 hypothetical protein SPPG_03245 [Spizellomyces punctatus DAOM BR117]|eukprot:XP_016609480.1 hypothetical protein SPPG_03245 [Spizellomyces punctatus DAOM BR117]